MGIINNYMGNAITSGKKLFEGMYVSSVEKIYNSYSPWAFAEKITRLAEQGKAKPIESSKIVDLSQFLFQTHWSDYLPLLSKVQRTVHVVNNPDLIKEGLVHGKTSERFSVYPSVVNTQLDAHNMLLCDSKEHTRLRGPFEKFFSLHNISTQKFLENLATGCFYCVPSPGIKFFKKDLEDLTNASENLSKKEAESSLKMFDIAGEESTSRSITFIMELIWEYHPEWSIKILEEWEDRFGKITKASFDIFKRKTDDLELQKQLIAFVCGGEWNGEKIEPSSILHAIVLEGLRLYPVFQPIPRIAREEFDLAGTKVQTGDVVLFNVMGYQRDANVWKDPLKFDPSRFKGEYLTEKKERLLNFSHGRSNCIGKHVAKTIVLFNTAILAIKWSVKKRDQKSDPALDGKIPGYKIFPPVLAVEPKKS